ncbi:hypothetical protein FGIG_06554, partial [Fasciola gigantica]
FPLTIPGVIRGRPVGVLVETGFTCSNVRPEIVRDCRSTAIPKVALVAANGARLSAQGKVHLDLKLCGRNITQELIVAPIFLGCDSRYRFPVGPRSHCGSGYEETFLRSG